MALKLKETVKGIDCEYWKIINNIEDYTTGTTKSVIGLYINQGHRQADVKGFLKREARVFNVIDTTREQIYKKWKESKKEPKLNDEGMPVLDDNGKQVLVETNKFAEAEDC